MTPFAKGKKVVDELSPATVGVLLLLFFSALIVLRAPQIFYPGRFWAEEGTAYFHEAYTQPVLRVLLTPNFGYYSLYNKVACLAAAYTVPLRFAPVVTVLFAFAAQMLPIALILFSRIRALPSIWMKAAACLLIVMVQPNQEVWLNTINSQFYLCVATGVLLISEAESQRWRIVRLVILAVAGLTGVVSCLLLPFFVALYIRSRSRYRLHEVIVLGVICAIQGIVVLTHSDRQADAMSLQLLMGALFIKQWALPFLGGTIAQGWSEYLREESVVETMNGTLIFATPYIIAGIVISIWGKKEAMLLFVASICIASISVIKSVDAQNSNWIHTHMTAYGSARYYFAPNVFLVLSLLMEPRDSPFCCLRMRSVYRWLGRLLVALALFIGVSDYFFSKEHSWVFFGPSWPDEVERWKGSDDNILYIWPEEWPMWLPKQDSEPAADPNES